MARNLKDILNGVKSSTIVPGSTGDDPGVDFAAVSAGERKFIAKHKTEKHADRVGNGENVYNGSPVKPYNRAGYGYKPKEDEKVYEAEDYILNRKVCSTSPDGYTMYAKKVNKDAKAAGEKLTQFLKKPIVKEDDSLSELDISTYRSYVGKAATATNDKNHGKIDGRANGLRIAGKRIASKLNSEDKENIQELDKKTLRNYIGRASTDAAIRGIKSDNGQDKGAVDKISKRLEGVRTAANKLTREEVEEIVNTLLEHYDTPDHYKTAWYNAYFKHAKTDRDGTVVNGDEAHRIAREAGIAAHHQYLKHIEKEHGHEIRKEIEKHYDLPHLDEELVNTLDEIEDLEDITESLLGQPIHAWIHDFVNSKNPKFRGKSENERRRQAVAAYYSKNKELHGEEFEDDGEEITEIAKNTLASYIDKASYGVERLASDRRDAFRKDKTKPEVQKEIGDLTAAKAKRHQGIKSALRRLTSTDYVGEETISEELPEHSHYHNARYHAIHAQFHRGLSDLFGNDEKGVPCERSKKHFEAWRLHDDADKAFSRAGNEYNTHNRESLEGRAYTAGKKANKASQKLLLECADGSTPMTFPGMDNNSGATL